MRHRHLSFALLATLVASVALWCAPARAAAQTDATPRITLTEFKALLASATPPYVIDVRSGVDRQIKGAHNIPLGELETRLKEIPRDRPIVTYCA